VTIASRLMIETTDSAVPRRGAGHGASLGADIAAPDGAGHGAGDGASAGAPAGGPAGAGGAAPCVPGKARDHGAATRGRSLPPRAAPLGAPWGAAVCETVRAARPPRPAVPRDRTHEMAHGAAISAPHGAPRHLRPDGAPCATARRIGAPAREWVDAEMVIYRLEEAGRSLLALPPTGYSTKLRLNTLDVVRSALEGYGWEAYRGEQVRMRAPVPDAARITRMDEALAWIPLIPQDRYVLRRIVGCRALVSPLTERHLYPWRRIGTLLGADHKAVQRWHAQGIDMIVAAVNAG
jgi:hypothetical protein